MTRDTPAPSGHLCLACNGTGQHVDRHHGGRRNCMACGGTGHAPRNVIEETVRLAQELTAQDPSGPFSERKECHACKGSGIYVNPGSGGMRNCMRCGGTGWTGWIETGKETNDERS